MKWLTSFLPGLVPGLSMLTNPVVLIVLAVVAVAGFGTGWTVQGWRLGADVARLDGVVETQKQSLETLMGANERCTAAVTDVKGSVKAIVDEGVARTKAAADAMKRAEESAGKHLEAASSALARPPAPAGKECETTAGEAAKYAKSRRAK